MSRSIIYVSLLVTLMLFCSGGTVLLRRFVVGTHRERITNLRHSL
jgi:hypothetical protein